MSSPADGPPLVVTGARRRLQGRPVLDGVDLGVDRGQIVGVIGPNGAGKTSLLRAIAGRLRLDAGDIRVAGLAPLDAGRAGTLGVVPQEIALYGDLTVRENLAVFARLAGVPSPAIARAVTEALAWSDLGTRAGSLVRTLSGGMRRRVNLVAGVLHQPKLLLLDEPTVGVDGEARARLHDLLCTRRATGTAVLLVTHDVEEAQTLCDRIAVMARGRVVALDSPAGLLARCFGAGPELSLTLGVEPSAEGLNALGRSGLAAAAPGRWSGRIAGGFDEVAAIAARLSSAGLAVAEVRLQAPTLAGAVARLLQDATP